MSTGVTEVSADIAGELVVWADEKGWGTYGTGGGESDAGGAEGAVD